MFHCYGILNGNINSNYKIYFSTDDIEVSVITLKMLKEKRKGEAFTSKNVKPYFVSYEPIKLESNGKLCNNFLEPTIHELPHKIVSR